MNPEPGQSYDDTAEEALRFSFDPSILIHPAAVASILGALVMAWLALVPERASAAIANVAAIGLLAIAAVAVYGTLRSRQARVSDLALAAALTIAGVVALVLDFDNTQRIGRLFAVLLAAAAIYQIGLVLTRHRRGGFAALVVLLAAVLLFILPEELSGLLYASLAFAATIMSTIVIAQLQHLTPPQRRAKSPMALVGMWFEERPKSTDDRSALYDKVIFEGHDYGRRVARFFALMGFAAALAALGVITDSTAVVIGAMLIAPLMTPLMGIAVSLSMGWPRRLGRAASIAISGALWAILIGVLIGLLLGDFIDIVTNTQIQSRISPTPIDLMVAIAAGGAGAFGLSRPDVSDSLPGVAIAISLVPPLTVVGICYSQGAWMEGNGALLLFLTNALAIVIIGSMTFVLTGVTPLQRAATGQANVRTAALAIGALALVVVAGLFLNGRALVTQAIEQGEVMGAVTEWIAESEGYELFDLEIETDKIVVTILGPLDMPAPTADSLATQLDETLRDNVTVEVRVLRTERDTVNAEH